MEPGKREKDISVGVHEWKQDKEMVKASEREVGGGKSHVTWTDREAIGRRPQEGGRQIGKKGSSINNMYENSVMKPMC